MKTKMALLCGAAATLTFLGVETGRAIAQTVPAPSRASESAAISNNPAELEAVVVEARRSEENQQDVPVAVSTVSNARLTEATVSSIADIQRLMPSLQVSLGPTGQQSFTIRGSFSGLLADPGVITYLDEVPIDSRTLVYGLFDLSSVQELKGPQGTLFGRNSTGGAVLFVSKKPNFSGLGGYVNARYGNLDERRLEGAVNIPFSETLALRVAGEGELRDGTIHSVTKPGLDFENRNNSAVRATLLWNPIQSVENSTQVTFYRVREHRYPQVAISLVGPCTGPTTPAPACLYQPPFNAILHTGNLRAYFTQQQGLASDETVANDPTRDNVDRRSISNTLRWTGERVSVGNIIYLGDSKIGFSRDYDGTPADVIDAYTWTGTKTLYEETFAYGKLFDDRLDWRVGTVFSNEDGIYFQHQEIFPLPVTLTNPQNVYSKTKFKSTAIYGQLTYDLSQLVEGLSVTAGYRYTWDDRKVASNVFSGQPTQVCELQTLPVPATGAVPFPNTDLSSCTRRQAAKFSDDNYNLTANWKPTDKILLYVATRKGYKTGSFNLDQIDPALAQYAPEVVKDVEVGLKADWRIGSMPIRTNLAVFESRYTDIQVSTVVINPATGGVEVLILNKDTVTGTSNKATIKGYEVEITAAPAKWLQVSGFYSKVDPKYTSFVVPGSAINLSGQPISGLVPETFGLTAQGTFSVSRYADELNVTASYYRTGAATTNLTSTTFGTSRTNVDLRASLRNVLGTGADVAVFGKNLGDTVVCGRNPLVSGENTRTCGDGRTYGVELLYRFGQDRR